MPAAGETGSRSFATAQVNSACNRLRVRLACISAPRAVIPSIRSITSRRLTLAIETKTAKHSPRADKPAVAPPPSDASAALDRLDLPQEALERLAGMIKPGASLIVSDNGIAGETGRYTDFIVLTR